MKIYVASSWRNKQQPCVVKLLREHGHEVYDFRHPGSDSAAFSWSDIDEKWKDWITEEQVAALEHPVAEAGFKQDFEGMKWADACVLVLPSGRSAHTEAGWMKGQGKPVFVFSPEVHEPELMYKLYDSISIYAAELLSGIELYEGKLNQVVSRPDCVFNYCPHPEVCKEKGCQNPMERL